MQQLFRVNGILDRQTVESKKILGLGLGSLGSMTIGNLAYPWRQLVLADLEVLEEHNVERHLLVRSELGQSKVEGVKRWLVDRGVSAASIDTHTGDARQLLDQH